MDIKQEEERLKKEFKKNRNSVRTSFASSVVNKQNRLNSNWNSCDIIFTGTGPNGNEGFFSYNQDNNTYSYMPGITTSSIYPATYNWRWDVAMWDDKLYCRMKREDSHWLHSSTSCLDPVNDCPMYIEEYQINFSTSSVTLLRQIPVLNYCSSVHPFGTLTSWSNGWQSGQGNVRYWSDQGEPIAVGHAMTMKDANTIIHGSINGPRLVGTGNWDQWIFETDISGTNGVTNALFPISTWRNLSQGGMDNGIYESVDILYIQNTDEYLISLKKIAGQAQYPERLLRLYSSSGLILDELTHTFFGLGLYISPYDSKIYITGPDVSSSSGSTIHEVTLNPLNIGPAIQNTGLIQVNGATHPNVFQPCNTTPPPPPPPSTTPCYNIGDIGPGGGIVFALPNTGINNSNFVYEINADAIQLATTPLALLPNECRNQKPLIVKVRQLSASFGTIPNTALRFEYGPGSQNPTFFPSDINPGDILNAFDITGNSLFTAGIVPQVTTVTLIAPSPPLFTNTHCLIEFNTPMNGPANSQPATNATFYVTPSNVPVNGAEWGGYDRPIITSELFGEGKKNTDIIAAVTQTNNPPSHPTVPSHDIAADLTLAFSQNNLDDWFLPSYEELEEAFNVLGSNGLNMLPNPSGINNEKTVYWTSTGLNPVNNQLVGGVNSNELAWCYITPFNTTFLYRKCKTLSVLPVRRFECPEDKGIVYDYRLAKSAVGGFGPPISPSYTPGNIGYMGDDTSANLDVGDEFSIDVEVIANGMDPSGFSQPSAQYPNGIGPGDVVVEPLPGQSSLAGSAMIGFTWDAGSTQFDPSSWGPMQYITPNGRWVFDDPGFFAQTSLPIGTVKNMTGNNYQTISNPYNTGPAVFVNKNTEIGRPWLTIKLSGHDVRLNYVKGIMRSFPGYNGLHTNKFDPPNDIGGTRKFRFNIKVYTQFEELIADYDYNLKSPTICNFCGHTRCTWELYGDLLNVNYVNPAYATDPNYPSVIDIRKHFGRPNGIGFGTNYGQFSDEGHGYVSIELLDTEFIDPQGIYAVTPLRWTNYNPPSWSNGRGNTLNLQNWMGTGLNRRATDPNNLPPEWSTVWNRFPWGAVCYPCGFYQNNCTNIRKREWMAELPYSSFTYWGYTQNLQNYPFDCTGNLSMTPNVVTIPSWGSHLGDTPALSYPNIPYGQVINAFTDLTIGHPCNPPPPPNDPDFVGDPNSKVIEITGETIKNFTGNENYDKETKDCIQQSNIAKDYEQFKNSLGIEEPAIMINIDNPNESFIDDNFSIRQNFVENNKEAKETGPFAIAGYYPLYDTIKGARFASKTPLEARNSEDTHGYHIHEFNGIEYYMPNGLELGVTQFHGDYVVEEQKIAPALCSYDDIKKAAGAILYPVYATSPQAMNIWYNNFITFQQNMWAHFQNAGCSWWVNRINLWTSQLPGITNAYQLALKNAKIDFAYQMNSVCGCPPIPPVAPQPVLKVAETIEEVEIIQDEQDIQPIEPVYTPPPIITPPEEDEETPPTYTPPSSGGY